MKLLLQFAVVAVLLLGGLYMYLNVYTGHGDIVKVPETKGMTLEEAESLFTEAGLSFSIVDSVYSAGANAGTIVEQNPEGGADVKPGRLIYLSVYRSQPPVEVIDIKEGESVKVAAIRLKNKGIDFVVEYEPNVLLDGRVIRMLHQGKEIFEGDGLERGSKIKLIVGQRGDEEVPVPQLKGLTLDSVQTRLLESALTLGYPFYDTDIVTAEDSAAARVYRQSPAPGKKQELIRVGSPIDIWLTLRPVKAMPDTVMDRKFIKTDLP